MIDFIISLQEIAPLGTHHETVHYNFNQILERAVQAEIGQLNTYVRQNTLLLLNNLICVIYIFFYMFFFYNATFTL